MKCKPNLEASANQPVESLWDEGVEGVGGPTGYLVAGCLGVYLLVLPH